MSLNERNYLKTFYLNVKDSLLLLLRTVTESSLLPVFYFRAFDGQGHGWKQQVLSWLQCFTCETDSEWKCNENSSPESFKSNLQVEFARRVFCFFFPCKLIPLKKAEKSEKKTQTKPKDIRCLREGVIALQQMFYFQAKHLPHFLPFPHSLFSSPTFIISLIFWFFFFFPPSGIGRDVETVKSFT